MIALFDPSLMDNNQSVSSNLGDVIIYKSVIEILNELFPNEEIFRVSTHSFPDKKVSSRIRECSLKIIGGSNLLSSHLEEYNQWKFCHKKIHAIFPPAKDIILLGVGWWQYQDKPDCKTQNFYKRILSKGKIHSVRDGYTLDKLKEMGINNAVNTSCPTMWKLDGRNTNREKTLIQSCIFTITDYCQNKEYDSQLIECLLKNFSDIYFFPQGAKDLEYVNRLDIFSKNKSRIKLINSIPEYQNILEGEVTYIGTRLHGGVKALQQNTDALILAVDNRATEIKRDINLPVIQRAEISNIQDWIDGKEMFSPIKIDSASINKWKNQFSQ